MFSGQSVRDNYMEEKTQQKLTAWQPTEHLNKTVHNNVKHEVAV